MRHSCVQTHHIGAFCGCKRLAEVELNEGLQCIGERAFIHCTSLLRINIPSTTLKIGGGAFGGCDQLSNAELQEGLHTIGTRAYRNCRSLERRHHPLLGHVDWWVCVWGMHKSCRSDSVRGGPLLSWCILGMHRFATYQHSTRGTGDWLGSFQLPVDEDINACHRGDTDRVETDHLQVDAVQEPEPACTGRGEGERNSCSPSPARETENRIDLWVVRLLGAVGRNNDAGAGYLEGEHEWQRAGCRGKKVEPQKLRQRYECHHPGRLAVLGGVG